MSETFEPGERVECRNLPWKGVIGTYVRKRQRVLGLGGKHVIEIGDMISGGSPRQVQVNTLRKVPQNKEVIASQSQLSAAQRLAQLSELHDAGRLTDEEYQAKRTELIKLL